MNIIKNDDLNQLIAQEHEENMPSVGHFKVLIRSVDSTIKRNKLYKDCQYIYILYSVSSLRIA